MKRRQFFKKIIRNIGIAGGSTAAFTSCAVDTSSSSESSANKLNSSNNFQKDTKSNQSNELDQFLITPEMFGAVGDGKSDDSGAIQKALTWLASGHYQELTFPQGRTYRLGSSVSAHFNGGLGIRINMKSPIKPDPGIGDAFTIKSVRKGNFYFYVLEGGQDANYNLADPPGGDQAFVIDGCRDCDFAIYGDGYAGRVVRTKDTTGFKLSFNRFSIHTGDASSELSSKVGQPYYFQGTSAFGLVKKITANNHKYGPVCDSIVDITYNYIEGFTGDNSGWIWKACGSVWIDNLLIGNESQAQNCAIFTTNNNGNGCRRVHIGNALLVRSNIGILMENYSLTNPGFNIDTMFSVDADTCALKVRNVRYANANIFSERDNNAVILDGSDTRHLDINVKARNNQKENILIKSGVSFTNISGNLVGASLSSSGIYSNVKVDSRELGIKFRDLVTINSNNESTSFDLPSSNNVEVSGGRLDSQPAFINEPAKVINVEGAISESSGIATISKGTNEVTVNHGLYSKPSLVLTQGQSNETSNTKVNNINSSSFKVVVSNKTTADRTVYWYASKNTT